MSTAPLGPPKPEPIKLLGIKRVVPMHHGTFPALTGTPAALRQATADISGLQIIDLKPGESTEV